MNIYRFFYETFMIIFLCNNIVILKYKLIIHCLLSWQQSHSGCSYGKGRPGVKGDLLVHDKLQNICFLLIEQFSAGGLNFLIKTTAPFPTIWERKEYSTGKHYKPETHAEKMWYRQTNKHALLLPGRRMWQDVSEKADSISSTLSTPESPQFSLTITAYALCFQSSNKSTRKWIFMKYFSGRQV